MQLNSVQYWDKSFPRILRHRQWKLDGNVDPSTVYISLHLYSCNVSSRCHPSYVCCYDSTALCWYSLLRFNLIFKMFSRLRAQCRSVESPRLIILRCPWLGDLLMFCKAANSPSGDHTDAEEKKRLWMEQGACRKRCWGLVVTLALKCLRPRDEENFWRKRSRVRKCSSTKNFRKSPRNFWTSQKCCHRMAQENIHKVSFGLSADSMVSGACLDWNVKLIGWVHRPPVL